PHPHSPSFPTRRSSDLTVFVRSQVSSATWMRHMNVNAPLSPQPVNLAPLNVVPGAVGTIAYGRYSSPEYMVHPGEYIPAVNTLADRKSTRLNSSHVAIS